MRKTLIALTLGTLALALPTTAHAATAPVDTSIDSVVENYNLLEDIGLDVIGFEAATEESTAIAEEGDGTEADGERRRRRRGRRGRRGRRRGADGDGEDELDEDGRRRRDGDGEGDEGRKKRRKGNGGGEGRNGSGGNKGKNGGGRGGR